MRGEGRRLLFLFWVVPAVVAALGMQLVSVRYNPDLVFLEKLGAQTLIWMAWGFWSLLLFAVCDRVPFSRATWGRALLALVPLTTLVAAAQIFVAYAVGRLYGLGPEHGFESTLFIGVRTSGDIYLTIAWAIVGAHAAFDWYDAWRAGAQQAAELEAALAEARLRALQAQLNPHFLFNALNSVVTLIGRDPASAQRMVVRLADLLRGTLATSDGHAVPLREELALVRAYLEIEEVRFGDRLTVTWAIVPEAEVLLVPSLVLQPLVENAIVHAVAPRPGPGRVAVHATVTDGMLELVVADDGQGPHRPSRRPGTGIGIANLRERLARLYGGRASLELSDAVGGGCRAAVRLPVTPTGTSRSSRARRVADDAPAPSPH
jgi:signal transduction histidine kinase